MERQNGRNNQRLIRTKRRREITNASQTDNGRHRHVPNQHSTTARRRHRNKIRQEPQTNRRTGQKDTSRPTRQPSRLDPQTQKHTTDSRSSSKVTAKDRAPSIQLAKTHSKVSYSSSGEAEDPCLTERGMKLGRHQSHQDQNSHGSRDEQSGPRKPSPSHDIDSLPFDSQHTP